MQARVAVQQSEVDQARAVVQLKQRQVDDLQVRAGFAGVLQVVPVEVGQQVAPGTNLARVADPSRLKAELKIAETQAKDIQLGLTGRRSTRATASSPARSSASIRPCRTARSPWTSSWTAPLPKGARPDLSVDGTDRARTACRRASRRPARVRPGAERRRPVQASARRRGDARPGEARPRRR